MKEFDKFYIDGEKIVVKDPSLEEEDILYSNLVMSTGEIPLPISASSLLQKISYLENIVMASPGAGNYSLTATASSTSGSGDIAEVYIGQAFTCTVTIGSSLNASNIDYIVIGDDATGIVKSNKSVSGSTITYTCQGLGVGEYYIYFYDSSVPLRRSNLIRVIVRPGGTQVPIYKYSVRKAALTKYQSGTQDYAYIITFAALSYKPIFVNNGSAITFTVKVDDAAMPYSGIELTTKNTFVTNSLGNTVVSFVIPLSDFENALKITLLGLHQGKTTELDINPLDYM